MGTMIGRSAKYGEASRRRDIQDGKEYDYLFPRAPGKVYTVKKGATLTDTVRFIPNVIPKTLEQTKDFAAFIEGKTVYATCSNIWEFVYNHIQYKKDARGYEQIRSPRRVWHDRFTGVDCDCYSVFISSVLTNLHIPHILRITKYRENYFQHIYPIVPTANGTIKMDCVADQFDYEVPYSEKKDFIMDLQYLDGVSDDSLADLGKKGFLKNLQLKNVLNVVNKINPATVLLRNGLLACMKLNVMNAAKRLRWGYLTPAQAASKGIDSAKFQKLLKVRTKLEKIFYGAGGKPANLKKAVLGGKGNKDKAVPLNGVEGLGALDFAGLDFMDVNTPLSQLLGPDMYHSENTGANGTDLLEGLGELGEPITLASMGAAMGVVKAIVASLKQVGDIFKGKGQGSQDFDPATNAAAENNEPVKDTTPVPAGAAAAAAAVIPGSSSAADNSSQQDSPGSSQNASAKVDAEAGSGNDDTASTEQEASSSSDTSTALPVPANTTPVTSSVLTPNIPSAGQKNEDRKPGLWDKHKKWLKPVAIGVGGIAVIAIGYSIFHSHHANKSSPKSLSGPPHKGKKNHHRKPKSNHHKKKSVALL